jgi:hypothetical protein
MRDANELKSKTSIHTQVTDTIRISSVWRRYGNQYFDTWDWETYVWDGDKVIFEADVTKFDQTVILFHGLLFEKYSKECEVEG